VRAWREHHALAFAAAQPARVLGAKRLQPKAIQRLFQPLPNVRARQPQVLQAKNNLTFDRRSQHLRSRVLQHQAGLFRQLPQRRLVGAQPVERDLAAQLAFVQVWDEARQQRASVDLRSPKARDQQALARLSESEMSARLAVD